MIRTFLTLTTALLLAWPSMGAAPKPYVTSVMVNTNGAIVGPTNFWTGLTNDPNFRSVMSGMVIPGEATNIVWSAPGANATASTNGLVVTLNPKVGHAELLGVTNFVGSTSNSLRSFVTTTFLGGATSFNTRTGPITLLQADVVSALGFSPTNSGITNGFATTASLNSSVGTLVQRVTDATNNLNAAVDGRFLKLTGGTMSGAISNAVAYGPDGNLLGASSDAVTNNQPVVRMGDLNVTNTANVGNLTVQGSAQFDGEVNTSAFFNGSGAGLTDIPQSAIVGGVGTPNAVTNGMAEPLFESLRLRPAGSDGVDIVLEPKYTGIEITHQTGGSVLLQDGWWSANLGLSAPTVAAGAGGFKGNASAVTNSAGQSPVFQGGNSTNDVVSTGEFYPGITNATSLATDATGKLITGTGGGSPDAVTNNQVSVAFENLTVSGESVATIPYVAATSNAIVAQMADLEISGVSDWTTFHLSTTNELAYPYLTNALTPETSWTVKTEVFGHGPTNDHVAEFKTVFKGTNAVFTNYVSLYSTTNTETFWRANAEGNAVFAVQGATNENINWMVRYNGVLVTNGLVNPPEITFHGVIETNATDATFAWTTTPATTGVLDLGETTSFELYHFTNNVAVTAHTNQATGLTAGTTYHYQVRSAFSGMWTTNSGSFETAASESEAFSPTNITGYAAQVWVVGSDYNASTGAWPDRSGNGYNFAQADADKRPATETIGTNVALTFDGVNDLLVNSTPETSNPYEFFFVLYAQDLANEKFVWENSAASRPTFGSYVANTWIVDRDVTASDGNRNGWRVWGHKYTDTTCVLTTNGTQLASVSIVNRPYGGLSLGGKPGVEGQVKIAEVIVYMTNLTTEARSNVNYYLQQKYESILP
jgi:hypothetical protein